MESFEGMKQNAIDHLASKMKVNKKEQNELYRQMKELENQYKEHGLNIERVYFEGKTRNEMLRDLIERVHRQYVTPNIKCDFADYGSIGLSYDLGEERKMWCTFNITHGYMIGNINITNDSIKPYGRTTEYEKCPKMYEKQFEELKAELQKLLIPDPVEKIEQQQYAEALED